MRALTVRQPWADLIMSGIKDVENRSWPVPSTLPRHSQCDTCPKRFYTHGLGSHRRCPGLPDRPGAWSMSRDLGPFPFTLGIHAAAKPVRPEDAPVAWVDWAGLTGQTRPEDAPLGVLLGTVSVTGCHHADECEYEHGDTAAYSYCSRWSEPDCWHWTLADPVPLDVPVPMTGRQRLWTLQEVAA